MGRAAMMAEGTSLASLPAQGEQAESQLQFQKPVLIYMPCYNCAKKVVQTIREIPAELHDMIECFVVDNCSSDKTSAIVLEEIKAKRHPFRINLIQPKENIGFAGSQKLALYIASLSANVKHVIVLHGDGQYPPIMLKQFIPYLEKDFAIVNGHRSKRVYPDKEETPFITYSMIKFLSFCESVLLGLPEKEWHSGLVMYKTEFLRKIPFQFLSPWIHIDGEFLMCAGVLKEKTFSVPIYKRYKGFDAFAGLGRLKYITHVLRLIWRFKRGYYHNFLRSANKAQIPYQFYIFNNC